MSTVPARVAADADNAMNSLREMAAVAQPPAEPTPPAEPAPAANDPPPPAPPAPAATPVDVTAELQRMNRTIESLTGRLSASDQRNAQLLRELEQSRTAPPAPPAPPPSLITSQDVEDYGQPMIDLIMRALRQEHGPKLEQLATRVAGLEGRIGKLGENVTATTEQVQQRAWNGYLAELTRRVPAWETINNEDGFLDWLEKVDTFSGQKRIVLLQNAHNAMDVSRVAEFFAAYKPDSVVAPAAPAATTPPAQPAPPAAPAPIVDPATLAAPSTQAPAPAPSQPPTGRLWKQSEVDTLYERKNKGLITPSEFERQEREYLSALAEGRVVANA